MTNEMKSPLLISVVPKTAGRTLQSLVARFHPDTTLIYKGELALGSPNIRFLDRFRSAPWPPVVMGHFSYGAHRLLGVPPRYATILRHPVGRIVSLYRSLKGASDFPGTERLRAGMSLGEYVASGITEQTNNHMCRMVAGIPPDAGMIIKASWLLDLAIYNLERHYQVVGIVERLNQALGALAEILEWGDFATPFYNASSATPPELDEGTLETVCEFNELDLRLYEYVVGKTKEERSNQAHRRYGANRNTMSEMKFPLVITHIPKTAGTSLANLVTRFHPDATLIYGEELENIAFIDSFRSAPWPPVVMGHFSYGVHRLLGVPPRYATILRHPVGRIVSLYRHLKAAPDSPITERLRAGMSLREYVASGITEMTNNQMCRMVAGIPPDLGMIIKASWLLDLAIYNLERHYQVVGIVERLNQALGVLAEILEWGDFATPFDNVSPGSPPELDDGTLQTVCELNELDLRLYEYVVSKTKDERPKQTLASTLQEPRS
jgi:hypothetical protein